MTRGQKPTYDVVTPLDVDYLDAFGEATDEDRAHWDRARAYGREVLERIDGHCWEVDDHCIVLTWNYLEVPGVSLYELIHLDDSGTNRTRTWHWLRDGVCFQRTIIDEKKAG